VTFVVHQSTIKCWRRCKRQYYYKYVLRLVKRRTGAPLIRGTIVHSMIEAQAEGRDPWQTLAQAEKDMGKLFAEEREYYGDIIGDIRLLMEGYFDWYKKDPLTPIPLHPGKKAKKTEHEFEVDLTPSIRLKGKIDMLAEDRRGHQWLMDHKTHKQLPSGDLKYSDIQSALYIFAVRIVSKVRPIGVAWNYIRWKRPTKPEVLKNGQMSRRDIDTTWAVYEQALIEAGLKPKDYQDMREKLDGKESEFYARHYLPVNDTLLNKLVEEAQVTAREIKRKGGHDTTRTIDRHCDWCDYYSICQAQLRGLDDAFIRKHDFKEAVDEEAEKDEESA
jgi:hypothetical protein